MNPEFMSDNNCSISSVNGDPVQIDTLEEVDTTEEETLQVVESVPFTEALSTKPQKGDLVLIKTAADKFIPAIFDKVGRKNATGTSPRRKSRVHLPLEGLILTTIWINPEDLTAFKAASTQTTED